MLMICKNHQYIQKRIKLDLYIWNILIAQGTEIQHILIIHFSNWQFHAPKQLYKQIKNKFAFKIHIIELRLEQVGEILTSEYENYINSETVKKYLLYITSRSMQILSTILKYRTTKIL